MNATTALEVPCFAIGAWIVYKLARLGISKLFELGKIAIEAWRAGDEKRTEVFAQGIADIAGEVKQLRIDHGERLGRIEKALDTREDIKEAFEEVTGVHAIPQPVDDGSPVPLRSGQTPPVGLKIAKGGA